MRYEIVRNVIEPPLKFLLNLSERTPPKMPPIDPPMMKKIPKIVL